MFGTNSPEIHGLDGFLELLDRRKDPERRERGLITVSNHISVIDDPFIWGALPFSHQFNPTNSRWSLGAYDIVFKNKSLSTFFSLGQVLPTHRLAHSPHGGLFQPTLTQAVRLLSRGPFHPPSIPTTTSSPSPSISDPFSSPHLTYTTNTTDLFPAPSAYRSNTYSWLHIFPEGRVHQHPRRSMRYFKWGVARLILEPDECPDIIPMWIEGNDAIMHESRQAPRWVPRVGKWVGIWFGENVRGKFGELRGRWRMLVEREEGGRGEVGVLSERLKFGREAVELRMECTRVVRGEVLRLRRERGLEEEDPKEGLVETWREEGGEGEGRMKDGSWVKDA
ncbi:hypothetical protein MMC20_005474 [Loxospora ochrophaea]|nr:hypothetical protein [Loxospora ochrophaea]